MFTQIFFLILILLGISSGIDLNSSVFLIENSLLAFSMSTLVYLMIVGIIYWQNYYKKSKESLILLSNLELLAFFIAFFFFLGSQRLFLNIPFGQTLLSIFSLSLYFFGLAICHYSYQRSIGDSCLVSWKKAGLAVRFLVPFILPFLFFIFISESAEYFPAAYSPLESFKSHLNFIQSKVADYVFFIIINLAAIIVILMFLPPLMVMIWKCPPLNDRNLVLKLDRVCRIANFKHSGFRMWTVMEDLLNAAIIGIVGRFRYILFTKKLIEELSPESVEAILAHEIGHSYRKHLLIYPFILFGMLVVGYFSSMISYEWMVRFYRTENPTATFSKMIIPLVEWLAFAISSALYLRIVFGYFSRLFERQADLHIFQLQIPVESMIQALDQIAIASGYIHNVPSWHHYSIRERINFLRRTQENHALVTQHHLKVKQALWIYFILLAIATSTLAYITSI